MAVLPYLEVLADDDATWEAREQAARGLYETLRHFGPGLVRRLRPHTPDHVIEEAIHKVVIKAALGTSRFRGTDERAARSWCNKILQHYVIDYFRARRRVVDGEHLPTPATAREADPVVARDLATLLDLLHTALLRLTRERDRPTVLHNVKIHLEARVLGAEIDEQIERWARPEDPADPTALRRARDRVYQYRRRGKVAACRAAAALEEAGEVTSEEAQLLRRILGCDEEESS